MKKCSISDTIPEAVTEGVTEPVAEPVAEAVIEADTDVLPELPQKPRNSINWEDIIGDAEKYLLVDIRAPIEQKILSIPSSFSYPLSKIIEDPKGSFNRLQKKAEGRQKVIFCRNGIVSQKFSVLLKGLTADGGIQRFLSIQQKKKEENTD